MRGTEMNWGWVLETLSVKLSPLRMVRGIMMLAEFWFCLPGTGDWVMVLADPPWHGLKAGEIARDPYGRGWSSTQQKRLIYSLYGFPIKDWDDPSPKKAMQKNHGLNPVSDMTYLGRKNHRHLQGQVERLHLAQGSAAPRVSVRMGTSGCWVQGVASSGGELNLPQWLRTGKLKDFYKTELKRTGTKQ